MGPTPLAGKSNALLNPSGSRIDFGLSGSVLVYGTRTDQVPMDSNAWLSVTFFSSDIYLSIMERGVVFLTKIQEICVGFELCSLRRTR